MQHNILTAHHLAEQLRWCQEHIQWRLHSGEQFSFPMNLTSCCLEHMDIPESIDIIMNVMLAIVFWNMIVSVVVVSWYC